MYPPETNPATQKILIFAGIGVLVLLLITFAVITQVSKSAAETAGNISPTPVSGSADLFNPDGSIKQGGQSAILSGAPTKAPSAEAPFPGALAKVGDEILYNSDLNEEIAAYPNSDDPNIRERLFQKMVADSITLQGAQKLKLITLDPTVYNSSSKDYNKRIDLVAEAKEKIEDNADSISGIVVQIWFNNSIPPAVGYAQAKQIASQKITQIYNDVKSGKLTMVQAGEAIRNDSSLYQVDEAYKINADFTFTATPEKPATFDDGFNTILKSLKVGEVSQIYTAKTPDQSGKVVDSVYMFGQVTKIVTKQGYTSYKNWLAQQQKVYAVTTY